MSKVYVETFDSGVSGLYIVTYTVIPVYDRCLSEVYLVSFDLCVRKSYFYSCFDSFIFSHSDWDSG